MLIDHVCADLVVATDAPLEEGPRFEVIPAPISPLFLSAALFEHLLHDGPKVGGKLELVRLERIKDFFEVLRGQQVRY